MNIELKVRKETAEFYYTMLKMYIKYSGRADEIAFPDELYKPTYDALIDLVGGIFEEEEEE